MMIQNIINNEPENLIQNSFFNNQIRILVAPAEGLYLQELYFDGYNRGLYIPEKLIFE